jgi:hypothetical protein
VQAQSPAAALLKQLKDSPEYQELLPQLATSEPSESWQDENLHFFVFELMDQDGTITSEAEKRVVVITMRPAEASPVSVVVVSPGENGEEAQVRDMRQPQHEFTVPYVQQDV